MTTVVDVPTRADGLQLCGTMAGSGYRTPPCLVRRSDGQTLQLTPLLYSVLEAVDGRRSTAEIAALVSQELRRAVTPEVVATLVAEHLRPLGLLRMADGTEPPVRRSNPLLSLKFRIRATDPRTTRRLTDPFRFLFRTPLVLAVVAAFLAITWWVFFERGLGPAAYDAFQRPHLLLLVFVVTILSGGFHEFGHAAAARYSGAQPGVMGAGIYIVWPAFYTDVTDSYRLPRSGRLRTDLGGLYFNALVVVLTFGWWWWTGWESLLLLVATQTMQMVQQLLPLMRFDGYHVLADLAGVPDLYHRIKPTLLGLLPHRWFDPHNRVLKPWARALITLWVLITIPMMALMLLAAVSAVPRLLGTAWSAVHDDLVRIPDAYQENGLIDASSQVLQVLAVLLAFLGCALILSRVGVRWFKGLASWAQGSFPRRVVAAAVATTAITGLAWAWWPNPGTYEPLGPDDRGLLTALAPGSDQAGARARPGILPVVGSAAGARLESGEPLQATFPDGENLPTKDHPELAVVLIPAGQGDTTDAPDSGADEWVFPFDQPLPPEEGDNQALAVNTTDGSTVYDVAFALVWATDDEVMNVNEAHAYASCDNCVTVAVAFQVVVIVDDAQVVAPQNLAVAANYECYECVTVALAQQLVLTVPGEPTQDQLVSLSDVWTQLTGIATHIQEYSLTDLMAALDDIETQILQVLDAAVVQGATPTASATQSSSATASPTATASGSASTSPSPSSSSAPPAASASSSASSPSSTPQPSTSSPPTAAASPSATSSPTSSPPPSSATP